MKSIWLVPVLASILILLISGTFLFNSAIGFGPGTLDQENPRNPGSAQSASISSSFGFELGQQYMQDASNLHSVDIFFHIQPGAPAKVTPVKVCIYQSLSLNFKTGILLGCVTKNVTEGPAVIDIDPTTPGTQIVENFEFSPNISQTPGVTYVVNVEEDRIPANSDTGLFWLIGQAYNPGPAVPDEVGIKDGVAVTDFVFDDWAFRTLVDVVIAPDLSITKNGPSDAVAGVPFQYNIRVENPGPTTATNVVVTDTIPIEIIALDLVSISPITPCTSGGSPIILECGPVDIPPSSFFDVFFEVTVDSTFPGPQISNQASVSSDNDPNPDNNTSDPLITTITPPPPPPPGPISADHYLGYDAKRPKDEPKFEKFTVELSDQFEIEPTTYTVDKPDRLYNPVQKTHDGTTTDITDDDSHYVGYKIKTPKGEPKFEKVTDVLVQNQFGDIIVDVKKPKLLLVPSAKDHFTTPDPLDLPITVNHFKCYDVKESEGTPKFEKLIVSVFDPNFEITQDFEVKKPKMLCTPVDKDGEGIVDGENHLMCYDVKKLKDDPKFEKLSVFTNNQFGPEDLEVKKVKQLCLPSIKTLP